MDSQAITLTSTFSDQELASCLFNDGITLAQLREILLEDVYRDNLIDYKKFNFVYVSKNKYALPDREGYIHSNNFTDPKECTVGYIVGINVNNLLKKKYANINR
jgi:hypothetical protein